jgi:D-tyrosyl-tRNA(Tyr) deacylase
MRAVVQRVREASVTVEGRRVAEVGPGLLVLLGVGREDHDADAEELADKVANLRIFPDAEGKMNRSLLDTAGAALVVSQFTLYGDCRRGRRPGYSDAAPPEEANRLYELFCGSLRATGTTVATGVFRADMDVQLVNQGPVTLLLDSRKVF